MAVNYIDGILEQNATEAQIEEAVRKVCSFLPSSYRGEVSSWIFLPRVPFLGQQCITFCVICINFFMSTV